MKEEEKKAICLLKALNNLEKKCKIEKVPYNSEIKKIRISLLPEDYGIFEILLNLIEKLQKENEELKVDNYELNNRITDLLENIPVQKVKDKIEEIQEEGYWLFTTDRDSDKCVEILQELIEERED